jgi:hypothetical protein
MLTLIVLAAGLGRRFGADKQIVRVGPQGQTLLDFTLHDAWRAGFGRVVFVLRPDLVQPFAEVFGPRWGRRLELRSVVQDPSDLPSGVAAPARREKPWGTLHATWSARAQASERCAVVNADDFYGGDALAAVARELRAAPVEGDQALQACLPGYPLAGTLSSAGTVNRGACRVRDGWLLGVDEVTEIARDSDGTVRGRRGDDAARSALDAHTPVSMNLWGWSGRPWRAMEEALARFVADPARPPQAEAYLPAFWDAQVRQGRARCRVLPAPAGWVGLTHPGDLDLVRGHVRALCRAGGYGDMPSAPA